ncbi:hypothetical protein HMI55_007042 [Coelomomyces lativittatus]|nr:hypothetical protein HMI55_007042 [Coelomomyces lativittatus]
MRVVWRLAGFPPVKVRKRSRSRHGRPTSGVQQILQALTLFGGEFGLHFFRIHDQIFQDRWNDGLQGTLNGWLTQVGGGRGPRPLPLNQRDQREQQLKHLVTNRRVFDPSPKRQGTDQHGQRRDPKRSRGCGRRKMTTKERKKRMEVLKKGVQRDMGLDLHVEKGLEQGVRKLGLFA